MSESKTGRKPVKLKASNRRAGRKHAGTVMIFLLLLILGVFMVLPIWLMLVNAVKPVNEMFMFPPKWYTLNPTLDNFKDTYRVLGQMWVPFSRYVFNSVFVTLAVTVLQCVFASMAAFCLAKVDFPGNKIINAIIVLALLYNSNVIYLMQYIVMAKLHMINTMSALIFPAVASAMGLYLMRQSMASVPDAMIEAAKVDGAGLFTICWRIVIPNQKPALMTMAIFAFQGAWNITGGSVIYDESLKTLPTVIQQAASAGISRQGVTMAAAVILFVPPVLFFIIAQSQVMETMAHSGIKD
ncbi:MAG: carbohydrate ABC transporter permease [Oscillospiraceae bacterium]|nr:carbohydrate ABC transporter permease [Oscillospiraceae bacterium]MBR5723616.1 carbohydrate ABC transporter permease [Oscillospiraceae bacterium]